jgi:hypothetical protein
MSKLSPFDLIGSINDKKYVPFGPEAERAYVPFVINRALSNFIDAVPYVHFLNQHPQLPHRMQYDYLYHGLRKMKRFGKWNKLEKHEYLEDVMKYFEVSQQKAIGMIDRLTEEQLKSLRAKMNNFGGIKPSVNTP